MKKVLLCAGVLALAASCTESELDSISEQKGQKGITFQSEEVATEGASTRGGFVPGEGTYVPYWYGEKDLIAVWGTKVTATGANIANAADDFLTLAKSPAIYKATKSASLGEFAGKQPDQILDFSGSTEKNPSKFFAIYPSTLGDNAKTVYSEADGKKLFTIDLASVALATQTQNDLNGDGVYDNFIKWSASTAFKVNEWDGVGEKIKLNFQRPLSGVTFSTANANFYTQGANSIFGKLKSVKLTSKGKKADGDAATADKLTLGTDAKLVVDVTDMAKPAAKLNAGTTGTASAVTLNVGNAGLEWSDAATAYMVIAPVERATVEKFLEAEYTFENITLTVKAKTKNNWEAGAFYNYPVLDINTFPYLVAGANADRTLIINSGDLASIFDNTTTIKWGGSDVAAASFQEIICNVALTEAELKLLPKFTAVTKITLAKNTSIPADAFKGLTLKSIDMPLVTEVSAKVMAAPLALDSLKMKSYNFENETVNAFFFNANAKTSIQVLDISGVSSLTPIFSTNRTLSFEGYTALTKVIVKDDVKLTGNAFNGCTNLETVSGVVQMTKTSTNAFEDCAKLKAININGTVIPEASFKGCTVLESVLFNKAQVVPTEVGPSAFEDAGIKYMDLSKVATLGTKAFMNSALESVKKGATKTIFVGAAHIPVSAFEGAKFEYIEFANATSFGVDILKGCTAMKHAKFLKVIKLEETDMPVAANAWDTTFGTSTDVVLFVAQGQSDYVQGTKLTLKVKGGSPAKITDANPISFSKIEFND